MGKENRTMLVTIKDVLESCDTYQNLEIVTKKSNISYEGLKRILGTIEPSGLIESKKEIYGKKQVMTTLRCTEKGKKYIERVNKLDYLLEGG